MAKPPKSKRDPIPEKVGYRQPPRHTQFRKGQSGNPRGRPKGSMNLEHLVRKRMTALVEVRENGKSRKIPMLIAILAKSAHEALHGRSKSFIDMCKLLEAANLFSLGELDERPMAEQIRESRVTVRIIRPDWGCNDPGSNFPLTDGQPGRNSPVDQE